MLDGMMSTREEIARYVPWWGGEEPTVICDPRSELNMVMGMRSVGKSWLEDRKTDVLYLIRSSRELVIEKEEEGE